MLIFQKKRFIRPQLCHAAPNQSALESIEPGASDSASNFEIQPLGADLVSFEVANLVQNELANLPPENSESIVAPATSKVTSAPNGWISTLDTSLNAPGPGLFSALRDSAVRHADRVNSTKMSLDFRIFQQFFPSQIVQTKRFSILTISLPLSAHIAIGISCIRVLRESKIWSTEK